MSATEAAEEQVATVEEKVATVATVALKPDAGGGSAPRSRSEMSREEKRLERKDKRMAKREAKREAKRQKTGEPSSSTSSSSTSSTSSSSSSSSSSSVLSLATGSPAEASRKVRTEVLKVKYEMREKYVRILDLRRGSGDEVIPERRVKVAYIGRLSNKDGPVFDEGEITCKLGNPLAKKGVIEGWSIGLPGARVGGKRRIICPPAVAYGEQKQGNVIPANSTLCFDITVLPGAGLAAASSAESEGSEGGGGGGGGGGEGGAEDSGSRRVQFSVATDE